MTIEAGEQTEAEGEAAHVVAAPAKQPIWTYFLTPAAILIGAVMISATIWWFDDDGGAKAPAAAASGETSSITSNASGAPNSLQSAFDGYAKQVGLDVAKFDQCLGKADVSLINKHLQRGVALGVTGTPTFVINNKLIVGNQAPAIYDEVIAAELKGSPTTIDGYSAAVKALAAKSPAQFQIVASKPDVSDANIQGSANAKVMVAIFSDFQCPFCKAWSDAYLGKLRSQLGDNIAIAFLHFPIQQIHPNAPNASLAAGCASDQGKFWQMHDLLFARQNEWANLR